MGRGRMRRIRAIGDEGLDSGETICLRVSPGSSRMFKFAPVCPILLRLTVLKLKTYRVIGVIASSQALIGRIHLLLRLSVRRYATLLE